MFRLFSEERIFDNDKHGPNKPFKKIPAQIKETTISKATGQLKWKGLDSSYGLQNVSGHRWRTDVLISNEHFLTARHCFDQQPHERCVLMRTQNVPQVVNIPLLQLSDAHIF